MCSKASLKTPKKAQEHFWGVFIVNLTKNICLGTFLGIWGTLGDFWGTFGGILGDFLGLYRTIGFFGGTFIAP